VNSSSPLTGKSSSFVDDGYRNESVVAILPTQSTSIDIDQNTTANSGIQFRRTWYSKPTADVDRRNDDHNGEYMDVGGTSHTRKSEGDGSTWGRFVFKLVGGVAGKMWGFCRTNAFGGFIAGGGTSYEITENAPKLIPGSWDNDEQGTQAQNGSNNNHKFGVKSNTGIEGATGSASTLEQRPAKRLHGSSGWVMVDHRSNTPTFGRPATPSSANISYLPRPVNSPSTTQPRRSTGRIAPTTYGSPVAPRSRPSASFASTRSPNYSSQLPIGSSPISVDVQTFTAKRRREEYETDASIWRLNQQLAEMIRQGQDALANKVDAESLEFKDSDEFS